MIHDPLCFIDYNPLMRECRICGLIAKVREDERSKDLDYAYVAAQAEADGQRDMLAKCIAAVEAVPHDFFCASLDDRKPPCNCPQGEALAELRALQEKP